MLLHNDASPGRIARVGSWRVEQARLSSDLGLMHRIVFGSLICGMFRW